MVLVNYSVEETGLTQAVLDTSADVSCVSKKNVDEMGMVYEKDDINLRVNGIYSTLGKVNLCITFNGGKKYKSIPTEFIVVGPDWPDHFPDLILRMPLFRENGATLDICSSKLLLDDNFAVPFEEVNYISTLSDSQIRAMTDFPNPTDSPEQ
jgi:hypothetical protein